MRKLYGHYARILHWCTDQAMTEALAQMDLTAAQGHILGYVSRQEKPPCPRDIEQAFQLSHPTVSGLLSRLEGKGFIRLEPDPMDRRCKRISVLPKGQQCHMQILAVIQKSEEQMVKSFTPEERKVFADLLERAIANMEPCHFTHKEETND